MTKDRHKHDFSCCDADPDTDPYSCPRPERVKACWTNKSLDWIIWMRRGRGRGPLGLGLGSVAMK